MMNFTIIVYMMPKELFTWRPITFYLTQYFSFKELNVAGELRPLTGELWCGAEAYRLFEGIRLQLSPNVKSLFKLPLTIE